MDNSRPMGNGWRINPTNREGSRFTSSRSPAPEQRSVFRIMAASRCDGATTARSCFISRWTVNSFRSPLRFAPAHQPESESHVPLFFAHAGPLQDLSRHYVVSPDGRRFLIDTVVEEPAAPITIILNWKPPAD